MIGVRNVEEGVSIEATAMIFTDAEEIIHDQVDEI